MNENRPLAALNFFLNPRRKDIFFAVRRIITEQAEMAGMHPASLAGVLRQVNNPESFLLLPALLCILLSYGNYPPRYYTA
jgi:hypothetical protein